MTGLPSVRGSSLLFGAALVCAVGAVGLGTLSTGYAVLPATMAAGIGVLGLKLRLDGK